MKLQDIVIIRLRMARRELHLSQVQASTKVGLSQTAWANYETGARGVSLAMLDRISRAFGKPVKVIWTREDDLRHGFFRSPCLQELEAGAQDRLVGLLRDLKRQGKRVVGYGATSKSTTVINYCGITTGLVEFISDTTPIKQGKLSPGAHIPVRPYEEFARNYPDYALLFAWNHSGEIMEKEDAFRASGGKWIVYVPGVAVLD